VSLIQTILYEISRNRVSNTKVRKQENAYRLFIYRQSIVYLSEVSTASIMKATSL